MESEDVTIIPVEFLFNPIESSILICDATCLERNLNLVLQILEVTSHVVVCINFMETKGET